MPSLVTILRGGTATRHKRLDVPAIAPTASFRGCESYVELADFAEDREQLFRKFPSLTDG